MSDTLSTQVGGDHYRAMKIQPSEFIHANGIGFIAGNVIKYVCRHKAKGGKQDLEKAAHYLQMLIGMEYPEPETISPASGKWSDDEGCKAFPIAKTDCPRWQNGCCDCEPKPESISNCQLCGEFRGHGHDCEPKPESDAAGWIARTTITSNRPDGVEPDSLVVVKLRNSHEKTLPAKNISWLDAGNGCDVVAWKFAQVAARKEDEDEWIPWISQSDSDLPPFPMARLFTIRFRDGSEMTARGIKISWNRTDDDDDVVAYKLADV